MKIEYNPRKAKRKEAKLSTAPEVVKEVAAPVAEMSMLKAELVALAEGLKLSTKGTKAELVDRINAKY